jgi:putative oxidoreductase
VGHGTQKLYGWFGGGGPEGTGQHFESLGLKPGKQHAMAAGAAEAAGGAMLAAGFLTPVAAAAISGAMTTAIGTAHRGKGPWITQGGWEYPASVIASMAFITEAGPGALSLDHWLFRRMKGTGWAIAAVSAGIAGGMVMARRAAHMQAQVQPPAEEATEAPSGQEQPKAA